MEQVLIRAEIIGENAAEQKHIRLLANNADGIHFWTDDKSIIRSIEPERKKGKWIFKERREPVYDISGVKTWGIAYMCPECGFIHTVIEDFGQYVYCPNCGADMRP